MTGRGGGIRRSLSLNLEWNRGPLPTESVCVCLSVVHAPNVCGHIGPSEGLCESAGAEAHLQTKAHLCTD